MATRDIYTSTVDEGGQDEPKSNQCPECGGRVTTNMVETICEACGLIIDKQQIDCGPEWRACDRDERKRTGATLTAARHDRGLSTEIGRGTDANGNTLAGRKRQQLARIRREHSRGRFRSKAERNLAQGLGEVRRIAGVLELPESIRDQACQLFRSAQNEALLPGRSIEAMAAASVYGACRCNGLSRTIEDISRLARVEQRRVQNAYKAMNAELGLPAKPVVPSEFIPQLASELEVPGRVRHRAIELAERADSVGITTGVRPSGFAAACLYKAGCEDGWCLTQSTVAAAANVSAATVRTHRDALDELSV